MTSAKRSSWEEWARVDPLWSIVTYDGREFGKWGPDDFFHSGKETIDSLWATAERLGLPGRTARGLDYGCGVGRLTRALNQHLDSVIGMDIAPSMIRLAQEYHAAYDGLSFVVQEASTLERFGDGSFDVVCCLLVLQHLPSDECILACINEFLRVLAPQGLLLLQLPEEVPPVPIPTGLRSQLRPRTRLAERLSRMGVSPGLLYRHFNWKPEMTMRTISRDDLDGVLESGGGRIAFCSGPVDDRSEIRNVFYFITRD
ncbi:MAG TPA: class I SAM-dependent methyltransferase [Acidimicrobiales bacterium]|nr:class I SAM-dependent methyltransferase [Acidimicrobiales bacterium]